MQVTADKSNENRDIERKQKQSQNGFNDTLEGSGLSSETTTSRTGPTGDLQGAGECGSARRPKDIFDGSAQDKSPCEVDSNEGLVAGRIDSRTGVHVESEVVLKCEGINNEGACDMLCSM